MNKKIHALLWGAFSTGGFISAFLLPSFIILNSILFHPSGIIGSDPISYENVIIRLNNPLFKIYQQSNVFSFSQFVTGLFLSKTSVLEKSFTSWFLTFK